MGKRKYFVWKGEDCKAYGIEVQASIPIIRPEERVRHVEIPGRSGDLTQLEGEGIFNSYIQTVTITVPGWYNVREVYNWLRGSGYVTFHGEPDRKQKARVIGAITLTKHSRNSDWWTGEVQFYCQPLKELIQEGTETITSSGSDVINAGDVPAKPRITATASATTVVITANGRTLTITGLISGNKYIIDCRTCEVWNSTGAIVLTANSSGSFPVLMPGKNTITGSGWSKLVIDRRQRFL